jgi:hypothetical protein
MQRQEAAAMAASSMKNEHGGLGRPLCWRWAFDEPRAAKFEHRAFDRDALELGVLDRIVEQSLGRQPVDADDGGVEP